MTSTYNADRIHLLLRALLGPTWEERKAADWLLLLFQGSARESGNPPLLRLLGEGTDRFGALAETFLGELTGFWMSTCAQALAENARAFGGRAAGATWPTERAEAFPLREPVRFQPFDTYGAGTAWYLATQARRLAPRLEAHVRGLAHPAPSVVDACWQILVSVPEQAAAAIEPMLEHAFRRGPDFGRDQPLRGLAALFDAHPEATARLLDALAPSATDRRVLVVARLVGHLAVVPPALSAAMLRSVDELADAEQRFAVLTTLAELAARDASVPAARVLAHAERLVSSAAPADRGAGAWGIARLGTPAVHEPRLMALLRDQHWIPRADAAAAASLWPEPSAELVRAVGQLLGDHEGHDGQPHHAALAALQHWGPRAAPAAGQLAAWLVECLADEPPSPDTVWDVVRALGPAAEALRPAVMAVVAAHERGDEDSDDLEDEPVHDNGDRAARGLPIGGEVPDDAPADLAEGPSDAAWAWSALELEPGPEAGAEDPGAALLKRIGIDPHEHIPGTAPSASEVTEPTALEHLGRWLHGKATLPTP